MNTGWPGSKSDIAIIDVEKGESSTRYLGLSSMGAAQPTWLPDGTRIAFLASPGYYDWWQQVVTIRPDGSSMEGLVDAGNRRLSSIKFSPDGARFTVNYCNNNDALVACVGGSGVAVGSYPSNDLTFFPIRNPGDYWYAQWNATWSPDGSALAFSRRYCSGCVTSVGYSTISGVDTGPVIEGAWDPAWRPRH
jgi:Tol biopolymer transport system component